jgi:6-phosphofructokinase 1
MSTSTGTGADAVRIGVLTSGGDAQGMNAAVRAVVRTAITLGAQPYAITEGYQGMVDGGNGIRRLEWDDVGSILHRGGTVIGTARCAAFRERDGRLTAAANLLEHGIDRLVVIGGDGSLTGADTFRLEWSGLLEELVATGRLEAEVAAAHPALMIVGLVGSIDNDLVGSDMTIGADSALHRITDAIDAIASTAASHQRSFVVEVMGRHCGYLPLMAGIAGSCDYVIVPEAPPEEGWEERMCQLLRAGRAAGRRESLVLVAEGAQRRDGTPIKADEVRQIIADRLHEDARVTILGHVQRGGAPSAFDRWMSTLLGYAAVSELLAATPGSEAKIIGVRAGEVAAVPMVQAVADTRAVGAAVAAGDYPAAVAARGRSFAELLRLFEVLALPPALRHPGGRTPSLVTSGKRIGILHAGGLAPGMNTAAAVAVRLGLARGHTVVGIDGSFDGLAAGRVRDLGWEDVDSWFAEGGARLGTHRVLPSADQHYHLARAIEEHRLDALLLIGGFSGYVAAHHLIQEAQRFPAFAIPIVCVPASIDNNLPGSEQSIGADTALNAAVAALDRIKQSGSATTRCFVAEVMGKYCGYLALMTGLASGAERVYLHEEGLTLADIAADVERMRAAFGSGKGLYLAVRNELANDHYTTDVLVRIFEEEGRGLFDVRPAVLGHIQQGGNPSPFDRILATRLVAYAIDDVCEQLDAGTAAGRYVGLTVGGIASAPLSRLAEEVDLAAHRPKQQWWLGLRPVVRAMADGSVDPAGF